MPSKAFDLATLIASAWRLGVGDRPIPAVGNTLDLALRRVANHLALDGIRDDLLFYVSNVGTRSDLLAEALDWGVSGCMLTLDGSTYTTYRVLVGECTAHSYLAEVGIPLDVGVAFGRALGAACDEVAAEMAAHRT